MSLDSYRDPRLVDRLLDQVRGILAGRPDPLVLMEVCGTHTVAISRSGLRDLLRGTVELRSGPGCPVCVTSQADIDRMVALARLPGVTVLTYGDMLRVPGSYGSLEEARAVGADVRVVYSALQALQMVDGTDRTYVFLGVGFETTAPGVGLALEEARRRNLKGFSVLSVHKTLPPALRALLEAGTARGRSSVQGFILPGHVSAVIGRQAYDFLAREFGLPGAVTGFEPVDILLAVRELAALLCRPDGAPQVLNLYPRVVRERGNPRAQELLARVFEPATAEWRGLGVLDASGLALREEWADFDAWRRLGRTAEDWLAERGPAAGAVSGCRCGDVLRGELVPPECPLFGRACYPGRPVGPCMVSSEGSCAAYYRYEKRGAWS